MFIVGLNDNKEYVGYYREGIHADIPELSIRITEDLRVKLAEIGIFRVKDEVVLDPHRIYTIEDFDIFQKITKVLEEPEPTPVDNLEVSNANLYLESARNKLIIQNLDTQQAELYLDSAKKDLKIKELENAIKSISQP